MLSPCGWLNVGFLKCKALKCKALKCQFDCTSYIKCKTLTVGCDVQAEILRLKRRRDLQRAESSAERALHAHRRALACDFKRGRQKEFSADDETE